MGSILIYLTQLWFLMALVILLHSQRERITILPLFFVVISLVVLLNFSNYINVRLQITDSIRLGIAGHIISPIILSSLIIVYIADGYRIARIELFGAIGANVFTLMMFGFVAIYLSIDTADVIAPIIGSENVVFDAIFIQRRTASVIGFSGALIAIVVTYQFIINLPIKLPTWLIVAIALPCALAVDSFLFFSISDLGIERFFANLTNDLSGKAIASLASMVPLALYLTYVTRLDSNFHELQKKPVFSILSFGSRDLQQSVNILESQLRTNRQIYEQLTRHINEIFWMVDAKTQTVIYISPAFEQITGYDPKQYHGRLEKFMTLIHPDDRDRDVIRTNRISQFRIIKADESQVWIENQTFSITDENGEVYRFAGVMQDITERKRAQAHELELELAKQRMELLNNFVRDASHDLKNPITSISLKLEYLEQQEDPERRARIIQDLRDRVKDLSNMIDDMFTLSRIESGEPARKENIDLIQLVTEVVADFEPIAHQRGLALMQHNTQTQLHVNVNREQMKRVISNLISNAIRYTRVGSISVETMELNGDVVLKVSDTGIGIPDSEVNKLFDIFFRASNASEFSTGTGLGLNIVKAIIDQFEGKISVESELNVGSTFVVTLASG